MLTLCNKDKGEKVGEKSKRTTISSVKFCKCACGSFSVESISISFPCCVTGVKRSYTFGPAGGGYEDPVQ